MSIEDAETLDELAKSGSVPPSNFDLCPERVVEIADVKLDAPPLDHVLARVKQAGLYSNETVESIYASLLLGNVILAGPPGTGKTELARAIAAAFNVQLTTETANPEWSVYDVIGSQFLNENGGTEPRHGIVTRAILDCANTAVANMDNGGPPQAVWLLIDELNRAEIDRAFGPLFTALSSSDIGRFTLDHWPGHKEIAIPSRFRIIATINDYDTRFVNSMSGALRRRFARVPVLPPSNDQDGRIPKDELDVVLNKVRKLANGRVPTAELDKSLAHFEEFSDEIRRVFGAFRSIDGQGGVPVGSALLIDTLSYGAILSVVLKKYEDPNRAPAFWDLLDKSLAARLIAALETDATRLRLKDGYIGSFRDMFPACPAATARLTSFMHAID